MYLTYVKSEIGPTMNVYEFINYELDFDMDNPHIHVEEEILGILDEIDDATGNEPIKETNDVQIDDVLIDKACFKDVGIDLETLFEKKKEKRR
jgi:hypothetical protein